MSAPQSLSRRATLLGGITGAALLAARPSRATATPAVPASTSTRRTTLIVATHPDDEWLYAGAYANYCATRGDKVVLLALSDGEDTGMGPREGLTKSRVARRRVAEQTGAWSALTYGRGYLRRARLDDSQMTYAQILAVIRANLDRYPGAEVYVTGHPDDPRGNASHAATWQAARDCGAAVVRYCMSPEQTGRGITVAPVDLQAVLDAREAYWWTLGPRSSVSWLVEANAANGYVTRYTR